MQTFVHSWVMADDAVLDDWSPLDPVQRESQISAIRSRVSGAPALARVLDLGCGDGSVVEALLPTGAAFLAVDCDASARKAARKRLRAAGQVRVVDADFANREHDGRWAGPFDLILCLGHTWMLMDDDAEAGETLAQIALQLRSGGSFLIDNFPAELWALVHAGDWQTGVSEDGSCQMILDAERGLIALRYDAEIDEQCESFKADDHLHRLWTMEQLARLAQAAGLQPPRVDAEHHLIWFDRP